MKTKRTTDRRQLLGALLSFLTLLIITLPSSAYAPPGLDDWEWGDEWGEAYATCDDCGITYMATDCNSSSDAESELAPYFCEGCGRCSQYGNDECYSANHCFMCGDCLDGDFFGPIYEDMDVVVCDNCAYGNIDEFFPYFCSFCGMAYGVDVEPCDCEYSLIKEHCTDCHGDDCQECNYPFEVGGEDTTMPGCREHGLCELHLYDDPEHCNECGSCDMEICDECGLCAGCYEDAEHCPECDFCFGYGNEIEYCKSGGDHCVNCCEENEWLCEQCGECTEGKGMDRCDDCGLCEECCTANSEDADCSHGYCIASSDYEEHLCPNCQECPDDTECEYCGLCEDCQADYHCEHGLCPDGSEWDEHLCPDCGDCYEEDELCEYCGECENCREHCQHDYCPESPDYDDLNHFICEQCSDCYEGGDRCDDCGLCESCCQANTEAMGCDHAICVQSDEFAEHWCYADEQCLGKCNHNDCAHSRVTDEWETNGTAHWHVCRDCGAAVDKAIHVEGSPVTVVEPNAATHKNGTANVSCSVCSEFMATISLPYVPIPEDGSPYIITQPKDYEGKVNTSAWVEGGERYTTFTVRVGGKDLKYQWYEKQGDSSFKAMSNDLGRKEGVQTASLKVLIQTDACEYNYEYYCVVTNGNGKVQTNTVKVNAQHVLGHYMKIDDKTHGYYCLGECSYMKSASNHRFGEWKLVRAATSSATGLREQTCMDCGSKNSEVIPKVEAGHTHKFDQVHYNITEHWYSCKCGVLSTAPKQAHLWDKTTVVTQPTEKRAGKKEISCSKCGITKTETIDKLPHTHQWYALNYDNMQNPNKAGKSSVQHYRYCKSGCGEMLAEPHNYASWQIARWATSSRTGQLTRECWDCGYVEKRYWEYGTYPVIIEGGTATPEVAAPGKYVVIEYKKEPGRTLANWKDMSTEWDQLKPIGMSETQSQSRMFSFKMPDGPVGLLAYVKTCEHTGLPRQGQRVEPTCTNYGHEPDVICSLCSAVLTPGARIEALGHDLPSTPIAGTSVTKYCTVLIDGLMVPTSAKGGYEGDFHCNRCGKTVKGKTTPLTHGCDGKDRAWNRSFGNVFERRNFVDATCTKDGRNADVYCKLCGKLSTRGEKVERLGHQWGAWTTKRAASTTVKGMEEHICQRDASHRETRLTDYSGPDYRLKADKTKLAFEWTYGETPKGQTVTFSSIGRNDVTALKALQKIKGTPFFSVAFNGLKMTITPIADEVIKNASTRTINLASVTAGSTTVTDFTAPSITLSFNIKKATPKFMFTSAGKNAIIGDKTASPKITGAADGMTFTYYSSDNSIAVVDAKTGEVKGLKVGTVTITAKFAGNDYYTSFATSYTLNVTTPDAIDDIDADGAARTSAAKQGTYDLSGRKVEEMRRTDVYVKDGKKVSVK
ncbi:MAG: Ig-like domain-containing protein [Bacteroidaceae bacterium]|nr:Ig-like domain-containing protein [Bacteroidaceae bacterium]